MPRHIKTTIIHKLGGYTYKDLNKDFNKNLNKNRNIDFKNAYNMGVNEGQRRAFKILRIKISALYGLSKQEWIDKVWYMITHVYFIDNTKNTID